MNEAVHEQFDVHGGEQFVTLDSPNEHERAREWMVGCWNKTDGSSHWCQTFPDSEDGARQARAEFERWRPPATKPLF